MAIKCILVIDDEADIREIAKLSLQITRSWKVLTAASGREGLAIAEEKQPDAILLDLKMPDMDGIATLQQLKQSPATQNIPVIFLTAAVKAVNQQEYHQIGAKAVLIKPFDPGQLDKQIEKALGWNA